MEAQTVALMMLLRHWEHEVQTGDPIRVLFYEHIPEDILKELRQENPDIQFEYAEALDKNN